jgi:hypothetical protein
LVHALEGIGTLASCVDSLALQHYCWGAPLTFLFRGL